MRDYAVIAIFAAAWLVWMLYRERLLKRCRGLNCRAQIRKLGEATLPGHGHYQVFTCPDCARLYEKSRATSFRYAPFLSFEVADQLRAQIPALAGEALQAP